MTDHVTTESMRRFLKNDLAADELLRLDDHLKSCAKCRREAASFDRNAAGGLAHAFTGIGTSAHLTYDDLAGLADGSLSPATLARAKAHAAECSECGAEVEVFRAFASEPAAPNRSGFFERFRNEFAAILVPVGATVLLIAIGVTIWIISRSETNSATGNSQVNSTNGPDRRIIAEEMPENQTAVETNSKEPPMLALSLEDGGRAVGLSETGQLVGFDAALPKYRSLLKDAFRSQRIPAADLRDLRYRPSATMGDADAGEETFKIVGPAGVVVDASAPMLRWQPLPGAEAYAVEVYDQNYSKVASSGRLNDNTSWAPRLPRGRTYIWQVTAFKNGKETKAPQRPAPEARFRLLDAARSDDIASLRRNSPESHLLLAIAYSDAGLLEDSERELRKVVVSNPRSQLAKKFLEQIRSQRANR